MANAELLTAPSREMKLSNCGIPIASPPTRQRFQISIQFIKSGMSLEGCTRGVFSTKRGKDYKGNTSSNVKETNWL